MIYNSTSANRCDLINRKNLPILRNHPHLGLLIPRLQFHENPIFFKWVVTLDSRSAT